MYISKKIKKTLMLANKDEQSQYNICSKFYSSGVIYIGQIIFSKLVMC